MIPCPCNGCTDRTIEPNCHNPKLCSRWKTYIDANEAKKAAQQEERMLNAVNMKAIKSKNKRGYTYMQGDKRAIDRANRKKHYLSGGENNGQR